ncbi:MAG: M23 family metallopeptidase [Nitrospirota bacterium]
MQNKSCITILLLLFFCIPFYAFAEAGKQAVITVEPKTIGPGDIAIITIRNAGGPITGTLNGKKLHFNNLKASSFAVWGIDLYTEPGDYKLVVSVNGRIESKVITVSKKEYPIQRLTLPKDKVELSPENEARADREQKKVSALWPNENTRFWSGNFINPRPGDIGTPFGVRRIINKIPKNSHTGIDVTVDEGEQVKAPNIGVVVLAEEHFFGGKSVILDHGQGIYTMFFHLSKMLVDPGQAVKKGDVIGLVGFTGRATGAHLHWGARIQGARVDPMQLIRLKLD